MPWKLRDLRPAFLAPDPRVLARTMVCDLLDETDWWIYLSPLHLQDPVPQIEHTIAHELAHIYLNHPEFPNPGMGTGMQEALERGQGQEDQANQLARDWGFVES